METCNERLPHKNSSAPMEINILSISWHNSLRLHFRQLLIKLSRLLPKTQQIFYLGYEDDDF
jgi:hypothetical protein